MTFGTIVLEVNTESYFRHDVTLSGYAYAYIAHSELWSTPVDWRSAKDPDPPSGRSRSDSTLVLVKPAPDVVRLESLCFCPACESFWLCRNVVNTISSKILAIDFHQTYNKDAFRDRNKKTHISAWKSQSSRSRWNNIYNWKEHCAGGDIQYSTVEVE